MSLQTLPKQRSFKVQTVAVVMVLLLATIALALPIFLGVLQRTASASAVYWQPGNAIDVRAGARSSCGIADGNAYCWGMNNKGQLGNGTLENSPIPVAVDTSGILSGKTVTSIDIGNGSYTCAVASGSVYCWGYNQFGQLGDGTTNDSLVPIAVDTSGVLNGKTITDVDTGSRSTCVIADGEVYCWGAGNRGELGDGNNSDSLVPVAVDTSGVLSGKTVSIIDAKIDSRCAVANGSVYCWGSNQFGQLGDGTTNNSLVPIAVDTSGVLNGKTVTKIAAGAYHTCAVATGQAYCWGINHAPGHDDFYGQLGDGTTNNSLVPIAVDTSGVLSGKTVTDISASEFHSCAVANGSVYCWGGNIYYSELLSFQPYGTYPSTLPRAIDPTGILQNRTVDHVSAGTSHTCVVSQGNSYCWGDGYSGELGADRLSPSGAVLPVVSSTTPEITSLNPDHISTARMTESEIAIIGENLTGGSLPVVTIDGQNVQVNSYQDTSVYVMAPPSATEKTVTITVTNTTNNKTAILENSLAYINPSPKLITGISFSNPNNRKTLTITGTGLVGESDPNEYGEAFVRSLVKLNAVDLPFCADGTGLTAQELVDQLGVDPSLVTDNPPCYYLIQNAAFAITPTQAQVWLPDNFDITVPGTVSVNGSNTFAFNSAPGDPVITAEVNNESLSGTPTILKRPTFNGSAPEGSVITVTVHSDPISCTTTADSNGNWSCTLPSDLAPGDHTVFVTVVTPNDGTFNLGPYAVRVAGETITNNTPLAPNTGFGRIITSFAWIQVGICGIIIAGLIAKELRSIRKA